VKEKRAKGPRRKENHKVVFVILAMVLVCV
jgi:hypothetical protein